MNNRIKELRKSLNLNQEKFGERLGVTKAAVSRMELGVYKITDTMLKLICNEYSVNEQWLHNGTGEMFVENDSTILAELANEYQLDYVDKKIIENYVKMSSEHRQAIKQYVLSLAAQINGNEETAATTIEADEIEDELERYRYELEAEKKAGTSLVSEERGTS